MEACIAYTVQVPNEEYGWSWTNTEGICRRKAQKGAYSAHVPEPGVAGTHNIICRYKIHFSVRRRAYDRVLLLDGSKVHLQVIL